jgi:hypothetical protein
MLLSRFSFTASKRSLLLHWLKSLENFVGMPIPPLSPHL